MFFVNKNSESALDYLFILTIAKKQIAFSFSQLPLCLKKMSKSSISPQSFIQNYSNKIRYPDLWQFKLMYFTENNTLFI